MISRIKGTRYRNAPKALGVLLSLSSIAFNAYADDCPKVDDIAEVGKLEKIEFTKEHSSTLLSTLSILSRDHYQKMGIDDALSQSWLERYIEFLDPTRSYFLASDITEFEANYKTSLDDLAKRGDLTAAKALYERYRDRAQSRLESNLAILKNDEFAIDYETDKTLPIDRDDYVWASSLAASDELWQKQVTLSMLNLKLSGKEESESREQLVRRYTTQLSNLRAQKSRQVFDIYLNALGHIYDPHTDYFSPRDSEAFEITMSLSLEGIGAVLQREDEYTKVVSVVPGGPAESGGELQAADRIVAIGEGDDCDFIDVVGWPLDDVVDHIRGPKDSSVRLKVIPAEEDAMSEERKIIRIVRDRVKLEDNAAKGEVIEIESHGQQYSLGVIDIPSFYLDIEAMRSRDKDYRSTTRDVQRILDGFTEQSVDGVIIDLRQNGGGSLLESATLTDLFIDPGPVVQIKDQSNRIYRNHRARSRAYYDGPLVVLIDRLSASASEIFAGAIQDYSRGLIIGSQSFGKGTVQSVQPLPEGQLKLTESKFYRISGESTQHKGVVPDIDLPNLFDPEKIGESSYETALGWDQIRGIPHRTYLDFAPFLGELEKRHQSRLTENPDMRYLLDTISINTERRALRDISLNEKTRLEEREYWDNKEDDILDAWRIAKGIPLEKDEDDDADKLATATLDENTAPPALVRTATSVTNVDGDEAKDSKDEKDNKPDISEALLHESGRIFSDLLHLMGVTSNTDTKMAQSQNEQS